MRMMIAGTIGLLGLLASACTGSTKTQASAEPAPAPAPGTEYNAEIDPSNFVARVDNPYLPFIPATKFVLEGRTDEGLEHEEVIVTDDTKEILGVTTTVVHDQITIKGKLFEDTLDWYAQDAQGNVWYFGEDTKSYSGNKVSTEGSWEAGVDGAEAGIIMPADPQVTDSFRQEFYAGHAEDMGWVVEVGQKASTPAGAFTDVVNTLEWTPLEPKVVVQKSYAPGVGIIKETGLAGGLEQFELLEVSPA